MVDTKVRIHLGQGDFIDTLIQAEKDQALFNLLAVINQADEWVMIGDNTAVHKSQIKMVYVLKDNKEA